MIPLPQCRWRRQPTGPGRHVCVSNRVRCNAAGIDDAACFTCPHRDHPPPEGPRRRCVHFGDLVGAEPLKLRHRDDGAAVLSRVHQCGVFGRCTPNTVNTELPCCMTCTEHRSDWERDRAGDVRHLMYHLYPAGPLWRWNAQALIERLSLFNGLRLVTVAVGDNTARGEDVAELFDGLDVDLRILPNDPGLREMLSHLAMIERLAPYRGDADVTFYGHGKGASSFVYGEGVKKWAAAMYTGLLDFWPAVRQELRTHAAVGAYRRIMSPAPAAHVPWHYSGSFRWVRNKDLYSRNFRGIDPNWYGPETYPGRLFTYEEASCLFGEFAYGGVGLYLEETWNAWAQASVENWCAEHERQRHKPQVATVILTAHAQPVRVHDAVASVLSQTSPDWQLLIVSSGRIPARDLAGPYRLDARVQLLDTGECIDGQGVGRGQAWAINEAWRRGRVRGDVVVHLSDDDVLAPGALQAWLQLAARRPQEHAWYGTADRVRVHADGSAEAVGQLALRHAGRPGASLRRHVDGMQVCHRRWARTDWPEDLAAAPEADGIWLERLAEMAAIHPAPVRVGTHRHTPESCFTQ